MWRVKTADDPEEFAWLARKWDEPIRRLCTRLTGDIGRGEELKQETFLRLFQSRKSYVPSARFSTFIWRIALNLCRDEFRRRERRREFTGETAEGNPAMGEIEDPPSEAPGPDLATAALEESELVRRAVMELPELYRTVVVLRHYENLKLAHIAEILGVPEGTVNSRMAEALSRLSKVLAPKLKLSAHKAPLPTVLTLNKAAAYESSET